MRRRQTKVHKERKKKKDHKQRLLHDELDENHLKLKVETGTTAANQTVRAARSSFSTKNDPSRRDQGARAT